LLFYKFLFLSFLYTIFTIFTYESVCNGVSVTQCTCVGVNMYVDGPTKDLYLPLKGRSCGGVPPWSPAAQLRRRSR